MTFFVLAGLIVLAVMAAAVVRTIYLSLPASLFRATAGTSTTEQLYETFYEQQLDGMNTQLRAHAALEAYRRVR